MFVLAGLLLCSFTAFSHHTMNLVVYSEHGNLFYVFINGVKQNNMPQSYLRVTELRPNLSVRIEFEGPSLPALKQNISLEPGFEYTAHLVCDAKKQWRLRYSGSVKLNDYFTGNSPRDYNTSENQESSWDYASNDHRHPRKRSPRDYPSNNASCNSTAMTAESFRRLKETIESKSFSDTKMSTAKIATKNTYLSLGQIKVLAMLFTMDDDRLEYAKFAYTYCVDKANYYQVSDAFKFSSTADELNAFLMHE